MTEPKDTRPVVKPDIDDPGDPPVRADEPAREVEEAGREDLALRGAAAAGALGGAAGYTGGAATGVGGAVGMRRLVAEEAAEERGDTPDPDEPEANLAQQDI